MDFKQGSKIIIRWPPGPNGKRQSAYVLSVPGDGRSHFQIQFERGQKFMFTKADLEKVFIEVEHRDLKVTLGSALAAKLPKPKHPVAIGCRVTVERADNTRRKYIIVPNGQGNQANNEIDSTVPIGAALLGGREGEEVVVNDVTIRIVLVEVPDDVPSVPEPRSAQSLEELDIQEDKKAVIFSEPSESMIVMSPPGTGKSFTLAHKAAHFIQKKRISPGELLILSFSREAVAEVKRRLQGIAIPNVDLVQPFTIDSFAASVLLTEKRKYFFESYDKSVKDATSHLNEQILSRFSHIFVDEFQDIVGIRADFITRILELKAKACGVTLLGDIEQSIYHWSLKGQESQKRSEEFLLTSTKILGTGNRFRYLTRNFRISNEALKETMNGFRGFLENEASGLSVDVSLLGETFSARVRQLEVVCSDGAEKYSDEIKPRSGIRTCVLFRDNGQLIAETDVVQKMGIRPRVLGKYNRGLMPSWYARLTRDFHKRASFLDRDSDFDSWFQQHHFDDAWDSEGAWRLLKGIEGSVVHSRSLDLVLLKKKIQYLRDIPMPESELRELYESALVFSTYHASKGLEFERVFLVEPNFSGFQDYSAFLDEARMFYVGLTRAKEHVQLLPSKGVESLRANAYTVGRVEEKRWYKNEGDSRYFNVDNEFDVDGTSFIMPFGFADVDEVQDLLGSSVKEGDKVVLKLCEPPQSGFFKGYFIFWKDKALGAMSRSFYDSMFKLYRQSPPNVINATIGRKYSEFRCNPYGSFPVDEVHANHYESWLALKLSGLAKAVR
jgi:hypothetical protein